MSSGPSYHASTHRPRFIGGTDELQPYGFYEIKVFLDRTSFDGDLPDEVVIVSTGDGKFFWPIPADLNGTSLVYAAAGLSVAGAVTVMLHNDTQGYDFLTTGITIDTGERFSYPVSTNPPVIDIGHTPVETGDILRIDVDAADGDAEGLAVAMSFAIV